MLLLRLFRYFFPILIKQFLDVLDPAKEDGFYLLKKDSQRRTTLVKIMKDDKIKICSTWHTLLMKDVSDSCIGVQHLSQLLEGMRSWLPEENVQSLTNTISQLREALDFDGAKINHLQLALYCFQVKYLTLKFMKIFRGKLQLKCLNVT